MRTAEQARANPMVGDKWEHRDKRKISLYSYEIYLGNDILDNQNLISKKEDTNMNSNILVALALSATKDATTDATRVPEGPLRQAFVDAQEERAANRRKELGAQVLSIIERHDAYEASRTSEIRSYKNALNSLYAQKEAELRAYTYGMETSNFVPWLVIQGEYRPRDITEVEWEHLSKIPTDWKPSV